MKKNNIEPVSDFNLNQYLGTWYEIARLPNKFEEGLEELYAEYFLEADGSYRLANSGFSPKENKRLYSFARIYFTDDPTKGLLKVKSWPFKSFYKIIYLDQDYNYVIVTSLGYNYLWILSRIPKPDKKVLEHLVGLCKAWKFDVDKLIYITHSE